MLEGFSGASRIPELRRRLLFTAFMLAVYRIGVAVPTPGIDGQALASLFDAAPGTLFGWANMFSGGALERFSIFALGIMPYISVAIILDLLKVAWPYLDELYKEGEAFVFMDTTSYDQLQLSAEQLGENRWYLIDNTNVAFAWESAAGFTSTSLVQNDILEVDVTATAGGGTLGQGLVCELITRGDAQ